jgi:uncharacterized membrane protein YkvA (DUF1232 family)
MPDELERRPPEYTEDSFWDKVKAHALEAGRELIEKALTLYYCLQDRDTPKWAKTVIVGALAYFIWPADAIPDYIAAVGFTDDLGAVAAALATVVSHVKQGHVDRARSKLRNWFGDGVDDQGRREG